MKCTTVYLAVILSLLISGCGDHNNITDPPNQAFVGTFEMEELQFRLIYNHPDPDVISLDTVLTVASQPAIIFGKIDDNPHTRRVDAGELVDEIQFVMIRTLGAEGTVRSYFTGQPRAVINENEFELFDARFESEITYPGMGGGEVTDTLSWERLSAKGQLDEDMLTIDFLMVAVLENDITLELEGTGAGIRQPF